VSVSFHQFGTGRRMLRPGGGSLQPSANLYLVRPQQKSLTCLISCKHRASALCYLGLPLIGPVPSLDSREIQVKPSTGTPSHIHIRKSSLQDRYTLIIGMLSKPAFIGPFFVLLTLLFDVILGLAA
jgi:hypothetical protein